MGLSANSCQHHCCHDRKHHAVDNKVGTDLPPIAKQDTYTGVKFSNLSIVSIRNNDDLAGRLASESCFEPVDRCYRGL